MKSFGNSSQHSAASSTLSNNSLLSSFRRGSGLRMSQEHQSTASPGSLSQGIITHQGALCRYDDAEGTEAGAIYAIEITLEDGEKHELKFSSHDFDFVQKLFAILDTESRGVVDRDSIQEFVTLRCPVFWRRDEDLRRVKAAAAAEEEEDKDSRVSLGSVVNDHDHHHHNIAESKLESPTFDEVWRSVVESSQSPETNLSEDDLLNAKLGVESWMVFCRFIALAQYLEAKRRFSARHLQQTMRHRNSPRGSELVVVDVPPPEPPVPLSRQQLANYERKGKTPLPLPELDLDHTLVAAHDSARRRNPSSKQLGSVKITLFGTSHSGRHVISNSSSSSLKVEFKVAYSKGLEGDCSEDSTIIVRRSLEDMKWLNDTFASHNVLGGTLCGRILPPFPSSSGAAKILSSQFHDDTLLNSSIKNTTGGAIAAASASVGVIKGVAKSIWKGAASQLSPSQLSQLQQQQQNNHQHQQNQQTQNNKKKSKPSSHFCLSLPNSYYNPNSPDGKARQLERYLNYLLEHPALSTSFPLNTILKVHLKL